MQKNEIRRVAPDIGRRGRGHRDMRGDKGRRVVDAIADHQNLASLVFQGADARGLVPGSILASVGNLEGFGDRPYRVIAIARQYFDRERARRGRRPSLRRPGATFLRNGTQPAACRPGQDDARVRCSDIVERPCGAAEAVVAAASDASIPSPGTPTRRRMEPGSRPPWPAAAASASE